MIKNFAISSFLIFFSFLLIYLLADRWMLPYFLYTDEVEIPNLVGHNIASAKALLDNKNLNFHVQYVPSNKDDRIGTVIHSKPKFGQIIKKGRIIDLKVLGLKESYPVPDLKFKSKSVALNILKSIGMSIDTIIYDYWDIICTDPTQIDSDKNLNQIMNNCTKYDQNIIWKQIPSYDQKFYKDDSITLFVSKGSYAPELYDVPKLIDLNLSEAINVINESSLMLGKIIIGDIQLRPNTCWRCQTQCGATQAIYTILSCLQKWQ